ncbi:regulatory signaling modulator protein AmpE [Pseudomonas oligotrophica]|uniref:regulatory signaling modulator protein AmpE n=1 Tax=Pseudomonas oligotrophica TaxID=2912055 RepID=UPI001F296C57|nr:regulatory signaling modulator protein AmpE [Pseudomonas oligotrophica]MCF7201611.1 regulatory signaling modulator protein AmpE [Pseudomonas oligotrophica]
MSFLVMLLALLVEKFSDWRVRIQQDGPWLAQLRRAEGNPRLTGAPWLVLLALVVLPALLLGLLLMALQPLAYGWLVLPLHLLVLLYALGRGHAKRELGPLRDAWRRNDLEAAALVAERDLGLTADEPAALARAIEAQLLWRGYQDFFAVIFWYLLLGPVLALAYRLLALVEQHAGDAALRERASQLRHGLDWLPVRLLAASFALVGNFTAVSRVLLHELLNWDIPARRLLAEVGPQAADLRGEIEPREVVARLDTLAELLIRARVLWYAAAALWVLLPWAE